MRKRSAISTRSSFFSFVLMAMTTSLVFYALLDFRRSSISEKRRKCDWWIEKVYSISLSDGKLSWIVICYVCCWIFKVFSLPSIEGNVSFQMLVKFNFMKFSEDFMIIWWQRSIYRTKLNQFLYYYFEIFIKKIFEFKIKMNCMTSNIAYFSIHSTNKCTNNTHAQITFFIHPNIFFLLLFSPQTFFSSMAVEISASMRIRESLEVCCS